MKIQLIPNEIKNISRALNRKGVFFYWTIFTIGLCYFFAFGGLLLQ